GDIIGPPARVSTHRQARPGRRQACRESIGPQGLCEVVILVRFRPKEDIQGAIRLSHFARGDFRWSEL
ncbi:MAG: hypothetical protein V3W10_00025, partial [candidate division NC10 bacterium]